MKGLTFYNESFKNTSKMEKYVRKSVEYCVNMFVNAINCGTQFDKKKLDDHLDYAHDQCHRIYSSVDPLYIKFAQKYFK
jgi:hypothetical protein